MADPATQLDSLTRSRGSAKVGGGQTLGKQDDFMDTVGARDGKTRPMRKGQSIHSMDTYKGWSPAQPNPHNLRGRM